MHILIHRCYFRYFPSRPMRGNVISDSGFELHLMLNLTVCLYCSHHLRVYYYSLHLPCKETRRGLHAIFILLKYQLNSLIRWTNIIYSNILIS